MISMEDTAKLDRTIVTPRALPLLLIQKLLSSIAATSGLFPCSSFVEISSTHQSPSISMIVLVAMGTKEVSMGLEILPILLRNLTFVRLRILLLLFANALSMQLIILLILIQKCAISLCMLSTPMFAASV